MNRIVLVCSWFAIVMAAGCEYPPAGPCGPLPGTDEVVVITVADYERSCEADDDCLVVYPGDVCGCGCDPAAISASAYEQFQADVVSLKVSCIEVPDCAACLEATAECREGICGVSE